jgi:acyl dehydratase
MAIVDRITIDDTMMQAFAAASRDVNPLHTDATYAARTPFGYPVVYGVLGLLCALRNILRTLPIRITHLQADFVRPLYVGEPYAVDVATVGSARFLIQLLGGETVKQRIEITYVPVSPDSGEELEEGVPQLRSSPAMLLASELAGRRVATDYAPDRAGVDALCDPPASPAGDCRMCSCRHCSGPAGSSAWRSRERRRCMPESRPTLTRNPLAASGCRAKSAWVPSMRPVALSHWRRNSPVEITRLQR